MAADPAVPFQSAGIGVGEQVGFQPCPAFGEALDYGAILGCVLERVAPFQIPIAAFDSG